MKRANSTEGFTLVELAIVLVIIGLLVGGVLVGQDLIKAAEIRAVSSDLQKYDTGAAAFRTKYNGMPGDISSTKAASFSLDTGAGTDGLGDGDGMLENNAVTAGKTGLGGENILFWRQLSQAQFIPFGAVTTTGAVISTTTVNAALLDPVLPGVRIRDSAYVHAAGDQGLNYYWIGMFATGTGAGNVAANGGLTINDGLSPREASGVDQKVDDGNAARGVVLSVTGTMASPMTVPGGGMDGGTNGASMTAGACYDTGVTTTTRVGTYNMGSESLSNPLGCALRIRAQF